MFSRNFLFFWQRRKTLGSFWQRILTQTVWLSRRSLTGNVCSKALQCRDSQLKLNSTNYRCSLPVSPCLTGAVGRCSQVTRWRLCWVGGCSLIGRRLIQILQTLRRFTCWPPPCPPRSCRPSLASRDSTSRSEGLNQEISDQTKKKHNS